MVRVKVGVRHNLTGPMGGYHPGMGDARLYARRLRPNAVEAVAIFESDWQGREVETPVDGTLVLTVMMDHVGSLTPTRRIVKMRDGWAAVIHLNREKLMTGPSERSIGAIADTLDDAAEDILARVALLGPRGGGGHGPGREARR